MSELLETIIDIHFQQDLSVQKLVQNFPPTDKQLFYKWLNTSLAEDWQYKWEYLSTLNINDYLRMYAQLPVLLINEFPKPDSVKYELFKECQQRYLISSIWLKQLIDYGTPNYQEIQTSEVLNLYRHDANTSMAQLDLCRAVVRHPKYIYNDYFKTPIYLWFWIQVATCIKYLKNKGIYAAVPVELVRTKTDVYEHWGKVIKYFEDDINNKDIDLIKPISIPEFLLNLPPILVPMAQKLLKLKYDSMLEGSINNYINSLKDARIFTDRNPNIQVAVVYKSKRSEELFISGQKRKRPKP